MTTAGTVLAKAAHILHQAAPPVTVTDLAKSCVNAVVWNAASSCRRATGSRTRHICVSRSQDLLFFRVIINDKLPFVVLATMVQPVDACLI